VPSVFWS